MGLTEYHRKRRFAETPEPSGTNGKRRSQRFQFVVQKHAARRLHYDFRLELDGVLKSWAVPKGPSLDPNVKSLAVHVEDHPLEYGSFEGTIPEKQYGAGTVLLWDRGTWEPEGDPHRAYRQGKLKFTLRGEKLQGRWALIRMSGRAGDEGKNWLLKKTDEGDGSSSRPQDVLKERPESVATGRTLEEIAAGDNQQAGPSSRQKKQKQATRASRARSEKRKTKKGARTKDEISPESLSHAVRRRPPEDFQPQLATLVRQVPDSQDWIHELKFDGYRLIGILQQGKLRLVTRRGKDWTHRFPTIVQAAGELPVSSAILDGEVVVLTPKGTTSFQALQNMLERHRDHQIVWYLFDLPFCEGYDLTGSPLLERKQLLRQLLSSVDSEVIRYSDHIVGQGRAAFAGACQRGVEGLICKRADSPYQQRRSDHWLKVKCLQRQEFVIVGWTKPAGSRTGFGALLLGYYNDSGELTYAGRVGTGFSAQSLAELATQLQRLERKKLRLLNPPTGSAARDVHWVQPRLVAEVEFTEWTEDGRLRHPSFQGLREDKPAREIGRELPRFQAAQVPEASDEGQAMSKSSSRSPRKKSPRVSASPAGVRLTNPQRILYPEQGLTKQQLADYYVQIAEWVLPHLVARPLTLVRCPRGAQEKCFYQKHLRESLSEPVRGIEVEDDSGTHQYVAIDDLPGLVTLVQMSVLEIHPWGSREDKLEYPDQMILDLDPGPGIPWKQVVASAREVRGVVAELGLASFVRTTGGKGLHVVVPLVRRATWETVKEFAHALSDFMVRQDPSLYVATPSKAQRNRKIYIDYLRNSRGATAVASYSSRAKPGAPVATPLEWEELSPEVVPAQWTIQTVPDRLASLTRDPWAGFFKPDQSISRSMLKKIQR